MLWRYKSKTSLSSRGPRYEVNVGLNSRRVGLQANVDEAGQEVVRRSWILVGHFEHVEHLRGALDDAVELFLRRHLTVNLEDVVNSLVE